MIMGKLRQRAISRPLEAYRGKCNSGLLPDTLGWLWTEASRSDSYHLPRPQLPDLRFGMKKFSRVCKGGVLEGRLVYPILHLSNPISCIVQHGKEDVMLSLAGLSGEEVLDAKRGS